MNLSKFLKDNQDTFQKSVEEAAKNTFENPEDGSYIVQLSTAELGETKSSGRPQIKWGYTILEGDLAGRTKWDYMQLDGQLGLDPLIWRFQQLGIRAEDVNFVKLEEFLEDLVEQKLCMKILLKTKKDTDFQNLKVVKMLPNYEVGGDPTDNDDDDDETPAPKVKTKSKPEPEPEADDEELQVGMKVSFKVGKKELQGLVSSIDEAEETANITEDDGSEHEDVKISSITEIIKEVDA